jgi:hypothetical protein
MSVSAVEAVRESKPLKSFEVLTSAGIANVFNLMRDLFTRNPCTVLC